MSVPDSEAPKSPTRENWSGRKFRAKAQSRKGKRKMLLNAQSGIAYDADDLVLRDFDPSLLFFASSRLCVEN
jgi:hypothetical protein